MEELAATPSSRSGGHDDSFINSWLGGWKVKKELGRPIRSSPPITQDPCHGLAITHSSVVECPRPPFIANDGKVQGQPTVTPVKPHQLTPKQKGENKRRRRNEEMEQEQQQDQVSANEDPDTIPIRNQAIQPKDLNSPKQQRNQNKRSEQVNTGYGRNQGSNGPFDPACAKGLQPRRWNGIMNPPKGDQAESLRPAAENLDVEEGHLQVPPIARTATNRRPGTLRPSERMYQYYDQCEDGKLWREV